MNKILSVISGITGIGAVEVVEIIPDPAAIDEIGKLLIQLIIGIITVWQLLKKKKK